MATPEETAKRTYWKQADIAALVSHYQHGGTDAARKALPQFSADEIDAKLEALGLLKMSTADHEAVAALVAGVQKAEHPHLAARAAIKALRVAVKEGA